MNTAYGLRPPGYRLPDETHIGGVRLQVRDLARSSAFYEDVLGFEVIERSDARVALGVDSTVLIELRAGATDSSNARRLGLYHFAILLPDRAALGRCLGHLARGGVQLGASDHLVSEALYLSDPDGLGIEIYRDRPRPEWRTRGQELVMSTEPLDYGDVLESAGGDSWAGMPPGTTIGHVHLHVGDLEPARAFYHAGLGLDVVVWSYPGALFFSAGGYHHHLGTNTWAGPAARPAESNEPRLIEWDLVLPSAEAVSEAAASVAAAGFSVTPEEVGGSIAVDPWGTAVRLTAAGSDEGNSGT